MMAQAAGPPHACSPGRGAAGVPHLQQPEDVGSDKAATSQMGVPTPTRRSHFGLRGLLQFCGEVGEYVHGQEGQWVKAQLDLVGCSLV